MHTDVVVIGGGPIGLVAARSAAEGGARTLVLEQRAEGSLSSCCTGLVSPRTTTALGVSESCVLREIRAVRLHLPHGSCIDLRSEQVKGVVIDRRTLEEELLALAREAGVDVRFGTEVVAAQSGSVTTRAGSEAMKVQAPLVIGADGPRTRVAEWFGLSAPIDVVAAGQVEVEIPTPPDRVDVFVGRDVAPGFFAWTVPAEEGRLRVGLGVTPPHEPGAFLDRLIAARFPKGRIVSRGAGWIPLSPNAPPAAPGVLLVGDAAGHVKPLSGGGLYLGAVCGRIAGEAAARTSSAGDDRDRILSEYPERCLDVIGKEQAFGRTVRRFVEQMRDEDVEAVVDALSDPAFLQFAADHADIDRLHELPDRLAAEPGLWAGLLRVAPLIARRFT